MSQLAMLASDTPTDLSVAGPGVPQEYGPTASFQDRRIVHRLTPNDLAQKFAALLRLADDYRKPFTGEWMDAYRQYNGFVDEKDKAPWQLKINVPLPTQAVDIAAARVVSAMFDDPDMFELDSDAAGLTNQLYTMRNGIRWRLRKSKAKDPMQTAVKDAIICGNGYMKLHYRTDVVPRTTIEQPRTSMRLGGNVLIHPRAAVPQAVYSEKAVRSLKFEVPFPTNIWLDPSGQGRWIIQRIPRLITDVWALARDQKDAEGNIIRKAVYDPEEVRKVRPGSKDQERILEESVIRRDLQTVNWAAMDNGVDLYEFWGDFPDVTTGVTLYRNCVATFAWGTNTIRMPEANPLYHSKSPFVSIRPKLQPHQVYGYGLLQANARVHRAINRQANVMGDKSALQVPTLEYDPTMFKDPNDVHPAPKFAPGKMFARKPGPPEKRLFYPVEGFQPISEWDVLLFDRLVMIYQMTSGVSEFVAGPPQSSTRRTKGEVLERVEASQQQFNEAAVHIEENAMGPLLEMVWDLMLQFETGWKEPSLLKMFGDSQEAQGFIQMFSVMSPAERWKEFHLDTEFRAVGISNRIAREKRLKSILDFAKVTQMNPILGMFVDQSSFLRELLKLYDLPLDLVLPQSKALIQAMQNAQLMQMLGPMMGGGAGQAGAGPGGAAPRNPHNVLAGLSAEAGMAGGSEFEPAADVEPS